MGYLVIPVVVQQKWAAATPELQSQPGFCTKLFALGPCAARWANCSSSRTRRERPAGAIAPPKAARRFMAARLPKPLKSSPKTTAAASRPKTWPNFKPEWVKPMAQDYRGYTLHEIPPNGQGIAALIALGHSCPTSTWPACQSGWRGFAAPADRGHEAGLCRPTATWPIRGFMECRPSRCWTTPYLASARQAHRHEKGARLQGRQPGQGRHDLPHGSR